MESSEKDPASDAGSDSIDRLISEAPPDVLAAVEAELDAELSELAARRAAPASGDAARAAFLVDTLSRIQSAGAPLAPLVRIYRIWMIRRRLRGS